MFFYQPKFKLPTRTIRFRDEWGELRTFEVRITAQEPTDKKLQAELESTAIWRET